jgi:outer membrane receptor protein involved in Fe transport
MRNDQEWNALLPFNGFAAQDYITAAPGAGGLGFAAGSTGQYFFTNHFTATGTPLPFDTPNGLVAPGGEWHVEKPLSAVQNQLSLRRSFGKHSLSFGAYVANYSQDNRWFFTDILTDVRDNPRFLDLVVTPAGGGPAVNVTQNGFRNTLSNYVNGSGHTTVVSGVVGGEIQLMDRLRADVGVRVEYNDFVQSSENTATFDADLNPATTFNNQLYGNNTFRHFTADITDWSASAGLNFRLNDNIALYGSGARGYKMPALDEYLNATAQEQVDLFDSREVLAGELGVKYASGQYGVTVNGFYTKLKNIVSQGAVVDPVSGATTWTILTNPEIRSYGAEFEAFASPVEGLQLIGTGTLLEAEFASGADIGSRLNGPPQTIGNLAVIYSPRRAAGLQLKGDMHHVGSRFADQAVGTTLPAYNYFNFGAGFAFAGGTTRLNVDLLNAFQSKGLEEGNPRIAVGGASIFLARPLLPRRLQASIEYDFGGGR